MRETINKRWDLDAIFPGGSSSPELLEFLDGLEADLTALQKRIEATSPLCTPLQAADWLPLVDRLQNTASRLEEASEFATCLIAQNVQDEQAQRIQERTLKLSARHNALFVAFDALALQMPEDAWNALFAHDDIQGIRFYLRDRRRQAQSKLPPEQEALGQALGVDGFHAWQALYAKMMGRLRVPQEQNGETVLLTVPQFGKYLFAKDRDVRKQAFATAEAVLAKEADLFAHALNSLAGFRLTLNERRGFDSILQEPLAMEAMSERTLMAMWETVERNLPRLHPFLHQKAQWLGVEKISYFDLLVPVNEAEERWSYEEAIDFILESFASFDPKLAAFATRAVEQRWLDVEERPGKLPNGFCSRHPESKQSRIQYTFHGSYLHVTSLAHELGHAYHNHVMEDLPYFCQVRGRSVAETASTFAEMVVADAAMRRARSDEERLPLLEAKAQNAVLYLISTYSAYLFERSFYAERKRGTVSTERLTELMVEAQKRASADSLEQYSPYQWILRNHVYKTDFPFYNFPYAFGYLFSAGVYARAAAEGPLFAEKYVALLRDTGAMCVEELAFTHLGVDLTQPEFWQNALDAVLGDVEQFLQATV